MEFEELICQFFGILLLMAKTFLGDGASMEVRLEGMSAR
jgi:hypothetical protein